MKLRQIGVQVGDGPGEESRSAAAQMIEMVGSKPGWPDCPETARQMDPAQAIIVESDGQYVSRGAHKLTGCAGHAR